MRRNAANEISSYMFGLVVLVGTSFLVLMFQDYSPMGLIGISAGLGIGYTLFSLFVAPLVARWIDEGL